MLALFYRGCSAYAVAAPRSSRSAPVPEARSEASSVLQCSAATAALPWLAGYYQELLIAKSPSSSAASCMTYTAPLPPPLSHNNFICNTDSFLAHSEQHEQSCLFFS